MITPGRKPDHSRAVGDTLSKFAVQLTREGQPVNLTGFSVKFTMASLNGIVKVPETPATVSNPLLGWVEYDFQPVDVNTASFYEAFFRVYSGGEPDTYPAKNEGILIEVYTLAPVSVDETGIPADDLRDLALAPRRTRTVEGTVEERSIDDLIKADRYLTSREQGVPWGIKIARTKPPGTCS